MGADAGVKAVEVLIVGAGPTGLMLAHLLARERIPFRIIDENASRVQESRAIAIQARTMELFQNLGIVERFLERGAPAAGASIYLKGEPFAQFNFAGIGRDDTPFPYLFVLSQSETEAILEETLEPLGAHVERQVTLENFEEAKNELSVQLKRDDGSLETLRVSYLVGCDGARSQVRRSSGLSFEGGTYAADFMLADAKVNWDLPYDRFQIFIGQENLGIFLPLKGSAYSRIIIAERRQPGETREGDQLETRSALLFSDLTEQFKAVVQRELELSDPIWTTRYRVHHRSASQMKRGRLFLAGDAAHIHSPAGGQGMNTGLQDAANLAWKLARVVRGEAGEELLESYHAERWPVGQKLLAFTDRIFSAVLTMPPLLKLTLGTLGPFFAKVSSRSFLPRFMFAFVSQLNIHYHPSSIARQEFTKPAQKSRARAGRRAPDAPLKGGGSLFQAMQGYGFQLLVLSKVPIPEESRRAFAKSWRSEDRLGADAPVLWLDSETSPLALERYGVGEVLVTLVRPDGYIGYQRDSLLPHL